MTDTFPQPTVNRAKHSTNIPTGAPADTILGAPSGMHGSAPAGTQTGTLIRGTNAAINPSGSDSELNTDYDEEDSDESSFGLGVETQFFIDNEDTNKCVSLQLQENLYRMKYHIGRLDDSDYNPTYIWQYTFPDGISGTLVEDEDYNIFNDIAQAQHSEEMARGDNGYRVIMKQVPPKITMVF